MADRTEYNREYARKRRNTPEGREQNRQSRRAWREKHPKRAMLKIIGYRARVSGVAFNVTENDIVWPTHCPVFGVELNYAGRHGDPNGASVDRKDNSKGYVRGNTFIISWRANRIKNDATAAELRAIANYVDKRRG